MARTAKTNEQTITAFFMNATQEQALSALRMIQGIIDARSPNAAVTRKVRAAKKSKTPMEATA